MMTTRISYGTTGTGQQIADFVNEVEITLAKGRRLLAKLNSASSGNDWTSVEGETGCPAGSGQTLWTILATAIGQLDSAQIAELARLDRQ